jgi:hypothetical protein
VVIVIIFSYFPETRPVAVLLSGTGELSVGPRRRALSGKQQVEQD